MTWSIDCKVGVPYSNLLHTYVVKTVTKCKDDNYLRHFIKAFYYGRKPNRFNFKVDVAREC